MLPPAKPPAGDRSVGSACARRRVELPLPHLVEVHRATEYLLQQLHCDSWYVTSHHDHQLVIRLTRESVPQYAVCFQCRPEVEKAIYHETCAWEIAIVPLTDEGDLDAEQVATIKSALLHLGRGCRESAG